MGGGGEKRDETNEPSGGTNVLLMEKDCVTTTFVETGDPGGYFPKIWVGACGALFPTLFQT